MSKFISNWFYAGLKKYTVETGVFSKKIEEKFNNKSVDFDSYAKQLQGIYEDFDEKGYDVIQVVPIAMGTADPWIIQGGHHTADVSYSITRGAVVIGKKKD